MLRWDARALGGTDPQRVRRQPARAVARSRSSSSHPASPRITSCLLRMHRQRRRGRRDPAAIEPDRGAFGLIERIDRGSDERQWHRLAGRGRRRALPLDGQPVRRARSASAARDSIDRGSSDRHRPRARHGFEVPRPPVGNMDAACRSRCGFSAVGCRFALDDCRRGAYWHGLLPPAPAAGLREGRTATSGGTDRVHDVTTSSTWTSIVDIRPRDGHETVPVRRDAGDLVDARAHGVDYCQGTVSRAPAAMHRALPDRRRRRRTGSRRVAARSRWAARRRRRPIALAAVLLAVPRRGAARPAADMAAPRSRRPRREASARCRLSRIANPDATVEGQPCSRGARRSAGRRSRKKSSRCRSSASRAVRSKAGRRSGSSCHQAGPIGSVKTAQDPSAATAPQLTTRCLPPGREDAAALRYLSSRESRRSLRIRPSVWQCGQ